MAYSQTDDSYRSIFTLALPLILSMAGLTLMQTIDAIMLSWYSPYAVAAIGPGGVTSFFLQSIFIGTAEYTAIFTAQYIGARKPFKAHMFLWQGIYFSVISGILIFCASLFMKDVFIRFGHAPLLASMEQEYFNVICRGAVFSILTNAFIGFFSGIGRTKLIMVLNIIAFTVNGILDYVLIFGLFGFPEGGVWGAAYATVISQAVELLLLFFYYRIHEDSEKAFDKKCYRFIGRYFFRFMKFGLPNGFRFSIEIFAWMIFMFFVGRIGVAELASTNIAWRINGLAFFPVIGLSQAISIIAGQSRGREGDGETVFKVTQKGIWITEVWMIFCSLIYVFFPDALYSLFYDPAHVSLSEFQEIKEIGRILLWFVGLYCILDGMNIIYLATLQSVGDTRWTFMVSFLLNSLFIGSLFIADANGFGLYGEWICCTVFIMSQTFIWIRRFFSRKWLSISMINLDTRLQ